jgi:carbon-monoxide dehydrogenase medium subunit
VRPPFAYHRPATLGEACRLLADDPQAVALAGGTDLMVHLRQPWRGRRPSAVVSLRHIAELSRIEVTDRAIRVGALASLSAVIDHPVIKGEYPILPFAARYMGSPAIRNLATVGGNLCNASPAADLPPVLLVLDALVGMASRNGERRLPLTDLFRGPGRTAIEPGEVLAWIEIPRRDAAWAVRYERLDVRRAMDIAIAGAALALRLEGSRVVDARIALCAVAPTARRVPEAERALLEEGLGEGAIRRAAGLASRAAEPIDDVRASAEYRREMVEVLVRRGLQGIADVALRAA